MNRITNAVISFFELVEAEGRELRSQAEVLAKRVLLLFFSGLLLFAAALAGGFAFYAAVAPRLGRPAAALLAAVLLAAPGLYALSKGLAVERGAAPKPRSGEDERNVR